MILIVNNETCQIAMPLSDSDVLFHHLFFSLNFYQWQQTFGCQLINIQFVNFENGLLNNY